MADNEYVEINGQRINIPNIALGKVIPSGVERYIAEQERLAEEKAAAENRAE